MKSWVYWAYQRSDEEGLSESDQIDRQRAVIRSRFHCGQAVSDSHRRISRLFSAWRHSCEEAVSLQNCGGCFSAQYLMGRVATAPRVFSALEWFLVPPKLSSSGATRMTPYLSLTSATHRRPKYPSTQSPLSPSHKRPILCYVLSRKVICLEKGGARWSHWRR